MNKYIFLMTTLLFGALQAHAFKLKSINLNGIFNQKHQARLSAKPNPEAAGSSDRFQQLVDLAKQGKTIAFNDLQGLYTGRCYNFDDRNLARNSVVLITQIPSKEGPLFPVEKIVAEGGYSGPADAADSMSKEDLTKDIMVLKSNFSIESENPLTVAFKESETMSHTLSFFTNQNYIFLLFTANQNNEGIVREGKVVNVHKGDIWGACYYFNKK